jgi:hypothetical protein
MVKLIFGVKLSFRENKRNSCNYRLRNIVVDEINQTWRQFMSLMDGFHED